MKILWYIPSVLIFVAPHLIAFAVLDSENRVQNHLGILCIQELLVGFLDGWGARSEKLVIFKNNHKLAMFGVVAFVIAYVPMGDALFALWVGMAWAGMYKLYALVAFILHCWYGVVLRLIARVSEYIRTT